MIFTELATIVLVLIGLATLRFGVPLLIMWLLNQTCCQLQGLKA